MRSISILLRAEEWLQHLRFSPSCSLFRQVEHEPRTQEFLSFQKPGTLWNLPFMSWVESNQRNRSNSTAFHKERPLWLSGWASTTVFHWMLREANHLEMDLSRSCWCHGLIARRLQVQFPGCPQCVQRFSQGRKLPKAITGSVSIRPMLSLILLTGWLARFQFHQVAEITYDGRMNDKEISTPQTNRRLKNVFLIFKSLLKGFF